MCDVILDTDLLEKSEYITETGDYDDTFKEINTSNIINDMIKKDEEETGEIFMPM